jgi:1-deoxy-D-xylulose-5-phosphate synthase
LQEREFGKGEVLIEGEEILLIALGHMNSIALEVAELIYQSHGLTLTVLDPIFVKPLDADLLCRLLSTHQKIVTIEEHSVVSGMGSIINNFLIRNGFNQVQVLNLGIPESFIEHGSHSQLLDEIGLNKEKIARQIIHHFSLDSCIRPAKHTYFNSEIDSKVSL